MSFNWLVFALIAMALFSVSNILLKLLVSNTKITEFPYTRLVSIGALALIFIFLAYLLFFRHVDLNSDLVKMLAAIVVLSAVAFISLLYALREGKVAIVTAILSLGTIVVAFLSIVFLREAYSWKEIFAMALALVSIFLLVL